MNPVLKQDANKISTITFDIYKNNQEYNNISKLKGDIILYCDGEPIMKMRAVYTGEMLQGGIKYQLEEMSARLNDIKCRPDYYTGTISQYLSAKISDFNTRNLDDDITFYVGTISGADSDSHTFVNNEYIGYWDLLTKNIAQEYELYLVPRYESNGIYIDCYSEENLPHGSQEIIFGENLVDKFIEKDATDIYTVLIPLGEDVKVSNPRAGEATSLPLTIKSVNNNKDYLENADGILLYGRKEAIHTWEGVTSASELKTLGQSWLSEHAAQMVKTTTITAVDLRNTGANIESFRWMHRVYVKSDKTNIGEWYTISKCQIPIGNPQKTKIQIGFTEGVFSSFTKDLDSKIKSAYGGAGRAMSKAKENEEELKIVFQKTGLNSLGENENLWSLIKANESAIETEVGRAEYTESGIISSVSSIRQTAESIEAEVRQARQGEATLSSRLSIMAGSIETVVEKTGIDSLSTGDSLYSYTSRVKQTADSISSEVIAARDGETSLSSKITQMAGSIETVVEKTGVDSLSAGDSLYSYTSRVKQTADSISSEVITARDGQASLSSKITQVSGAISAEVTDRTNADATLQSQITANAQQITLKVSAGDIASTLNVTAQGVLIDASKINMTGWLRANQVTVAGLYSTANVIADGYVQATNSSGTGRVIADWLTVGTTGGRYQASWKSKTVVTSLNVIRDDQREYMLGNMTTVTKKYTENVTTNTDTIYYLGRS